MDQELKNLYTLRIDGQYGTNIERFLSACDPSKFKNLSVSCPDFSDDLLAFVSEQMVDITCFGIKLSIFTPSFVENVAKLRNLKKLEDFSLWDVSPAHCITIIKALAESNSLEYLYLQIVIIDAINDISNLKQLRFYIEPEIPAQLLEKLSVSINSPLALDSLDEDFFIYTFGGTKAKRTVV